MNRLLPLLIATSTLAAASAAQAQVGPSDTAGPIEITGFVPNNTCTLGSLSDGDNLFDLGVMVDVATGLLRPDLAPPPKVLVGSLCGSRSELTIEASQMTAQSFVTTPPDGFSRGVNYTATASGWTPIAASYTTGAPSNGSATQVRDSGGSGDIVITLTDFATAGGDTLRPVADDLYLGAIVVTLAAAS